MVRETDIAWLAGIIDGEGCFSIKRQVGGRSATSYPQVWLVLCNTSKPMMERAARIMAALGIKKTSIRRVWKGEKATRWQYWIDVCAKADTLLITKALLPHLTAKRTEAEVVIWFLTRACAVKAYRRTALDIAVLESLSAVKANGGEAPAEVEELLAKVIPCQAENGLRKDVFSEGVQTRGVTPKNNRLHECPAPLRTIEGGGDIVDSSVKTEVEGIKSPSLKVAKY